MARHMCGRGKEAPVTTAPTGGNTAPVRGRSTRQRAAVEVDVLRTSDGESVYRRCSTDDHHHHLVCRLCGKAVEVEGPAVEQWAETIAAQHGYVNVAHTVEIFGTCADCA